MTINTNNTNNSVEADTATPGSPKTFKHCTLTDIFIYII